VLHHVCPKENDAAERRAGVILAHGTFSNYRTCGALARYLADRGHECWLLDFEGHGCSDKALPAPDFEAMFLSGTNAALNHISDTTNAKCHWVGHSGGGLAALMALARRPELTAKLHSLVMLGSQACDAGHSISHRAVLRLFLVLTRALGFVPARALRLGPENEVAEVMLQWYRWNLQKCWQGTEGLDYLNALQQLDMLTDLPVLGMAGSGDRFIAPPAACRRLHSLLPGIDNEWQECGVSHGFEEDFSHSRLISSRAAAREIWPRIADWLARTESK
jgi:oxygen-independent coproporphyrinogen-3 oxidase